MHDSVIFELTVFAGAGGAGVLTAFLYDLFRLKRRLLKTSAILVHIEDVVFWLTAAIIIFLASYVLSSGETRFYFLSGVFAGALIYLSLLSKMVLWALLTLVRIISWPVNEVIKFLTPIFKALKIRTRRLLGKTRNRFAVKAYYMKVDFRRLRNTMTKK